MDRQLRALARGAHVVIGTPGRVLDHLRRGSMDLSRLSLVVLDEADEMLDMGFRDDMEAILAQTPPLAQRALFSATMPAPVLELARRYLNNPQRIHIAGKELTVPGVAQQWFDVKTHQKLDALCRVLDTQNPSKALVFCSTRQGTDELANQLRGRGYQADSLHGNLSQNQRDRVMKRFRDGSLDLLVATDVAARGLDVDNVDMVINYSMPNDVENYVHRIGRTGRAGKTGKAITFVSPREIHILRDIIKRTRAVVTQAQLPSARDVEAVKTAQLFGEIRTVLENGQDAPYAGLVDSLTDEGIDARQTAAALFMLYTRREGGEADSRQEPDAPGGQGAKADMARLFFNVGHKMKTGPSDIVGAITGESGLPGRIVGAIDIRDRMSFVEVVEEHAPAVLQALQGKMLRGVRLAVERAVPPNGKKTRKQDRPG
jgi:ATP-dependent RNA helicase DeaD